MASLIERRMYEKYGRDIATPEQRRNALWYMRWMDHEVLRNIYDNFGIIAPGAYRANHPNRSRLERYRQLGVRVVVNLRGTETGAPFLFEQEDCAALDLKLVNFKFSAQRPPDPQETLALIETLKTLDEPFLIHCKSGADRTGLAAAIYLIVVHDVRPELAISELSVRYLHFSRSKTGILDHFIASYGEACARAPISLEEWIKTAYDPIQLTEDFNRKRRGR